jgi:hypothetical protein
MFRYTVRSFLNPTYIIRCLDSDVLLFVMPIAVLPLINTIVLSNSRIIVDPKDRQFHQVSTAILWYMSPLLSNEEYVLTHTIHVMEHLHCIVWEKD